MDVVKPLGAALLAPVTGGASLMLLGSKTPKVSAPAPPEAPKAPSTQTQAVQEASAQAAARRSRSAGFRSTILSKLGGGNLKETIGA